VSTSYARYAITTLGGEDVKTLVAVRPEHHLMAQLIAVALFTFGPGLLGQFLASHYFGIGETGIRLFVVPLMYALWFGLLSFSRTSLRHVVALGMMIYFGIQLWASMTQVLQGADRVSWIQPCSALFWLTAAAGLAFWDLRRSARLAAAHHAAEVEARATQQAQVMLRAREIADRTPGTEAPNDRPT
jgi:hypothetical protein